MKNKVTTDEQKDYARSYACLSGYYILSAKELYRLIRENVTSKTGLYAGTFGYPMATLFTHGIELGLKSFLISKDAEFVSDDLKKLRDMGHEIMKIYKECEKLDNDKSFTNGELKSFLKNFTGFFYPDTIKPRYPRLTEGFKFSEQDFWLARELITEPLEKIIKE